MITILEILSPIPCSLCLYLVSRPVPFIPRDGTGQDGIGTGFSKWDGIVPTLSRIHGPVGEIGNRLKTAVELICPHRPERDWRRKSGMSRRRDGMSTEITRQSKIKDSFLVYKTSI